MTYVVFSDIDGTLIDFQTYAVDEVATAVAQLIAAHIPLILCSSKTRAEQQYYRDLLHIADPFIVENGSAIFVPQRYFPWAAGGRLLDGYEVLELGIDVTHIRAALAAVRAATGITFQTYADLSVAEVSQITGLDRVAAARAQQREYSATIVTPLTPPMLQTLRAALAAYGLMLVSGGKFHTVTSAQSDKGTAVTRLTQLFQRHFGDVTTIGLGDSANDAPLLAAVDRPYLVQKPGGIWQDMGDLAVNRVTAVGPAGWRQVVMALAPPASNLRHH